MNLITFVTTSVQLIYRFSVFCTTLYFVIICNIWPYIPAYLSLSPAEVPILWVNRVSWWWGHISSAVVQIPFGWCFIFGSFKKRSPGPSIDIGFSVSFNSRSHFEHYHHRSQRCHLTNKRFNQWAPRIQTVAPKTWILIVLFSCQSGVTSICIFTTDCRYTRRNHRAFSWYVCWNWSAVGSPLIIVQRVWVVQI